MPPPSEADKALFRARNKRVRDMVLQYAPDGGPFAVPLQAGGQVQFQSLTTSTNAEGVEVLEVYLLGDTVSGDPHFVITNPPTFVRQRDGSLLDNPVAAVAEIIAKAGGRQKGRKGT